MKSGRYYKGHYVSSEGEGTEGFADVKIDGKRYRIDKEGKIIQ